MRSTSSAHTDEPPATGDGPADHERAGDGPADHDIWVPAQQAAVALAAPERWLREECRAGHLRCHGEPRTGQVFLVPMTATEELAERRTTRR